MAIGTLKREAGVVGAVLLGLGSILGTGVFVIVGMAAGMAGWGLLVAIMLAAFVALANGLNSAQLAARYPVSGGTYEYGYRLLRPELGFTAGWMFLLAKSASAATAALAVANYLAPEMPVPVALLLVVAMTALVISGLRRSNGANAVIVGFVLLVLISYSVNGLCGSGQPTGFEFSATGTLQAAALVFVGYTGYGRIATMGEEISNPRRNIPLAMYCTLGLSTLVFMGVGIAALRGVATPGIWAFAGAVAMLGVLLNLTLGLSRVVLAMSRRHDLPGVFAVLDAGEQPRAAIILVGGVIGVITLIGDIKIAWSFSAFTVLIYYSITNLSALSLRDEERLYPGWLALAGLAGCLFLAFWVPVAIWLTGLATIVIGLLLQRYLFRAISL